jgi:hypothetical protein
MEGTIMKRMAGKLLTAAAVAALGATTSQAGPPTQANTPGAPLMSVADAQGRTQRPPAPEVWSFRVEYRTRRGAQFPWGPWRQYTTITGDYATAKKRANNVADSIEARSKNHQTRIIEKRIR